jgi:sortase (surface protein transpeptidase)
MRLLSRRSFAGCLASVLIIAALVGLRNKETGEALVEPPPSPVLPSSTPQAIQTDASPTTAPTIQPTPTPIVLGPLFAADIDIKAAPVMVPLELRIPALKVSAPVFGVGLTSENVMDAPKGPIDDPVWHTAFWYRGSGIPGESGTATFAGHINDPLGRFEIFADLEDLKPGDLIIVFYTSLNIEIQFLVDEVKVYSLQETSDREVLTQIFGAGPVEGTPPQPAPDGLSHLTLITCAGNIVDGKFDHHTVVYATRSN